MSLRWGAASRLTAALGRLIGRRTGLEGLRVTVLGLRHHVSRDTVRYLERQKADVTVAGPPKEVELLRRDLELLHVKVKLAPIDTITGSEVRLITENLRALGQLPHVIVCCCTDSDCWAQTFVPVMQPTLALHLAANGTAGAGGNPPVFATRTLAALLRDRGLFDPSRALAKVRLGRGLFDVSRRDAQLGRAPRRHPGVQDRPVRPPKSALRQGAPFRRTVRSRLDSSLHQGDQI